MESILPALNTKKTRKMSTLLFWSALKSSLVAFPPDKPEHNKQIRPEIKTLWGEIAWRLWLL
jgi:hypothetical protein